MSKKNKIADGPMGGPGMIGTEKAKDFKGTMKKLLRNLSPFKIGIFFVVVFAIGSATFNIIGPKILGNATNEIFEGISSKISGDSSGINFESIGRTLGILVLIYLISSIFSFIQGVIKIGRAHV